MQFYIRAEGHIHYLAWIEVNEEVTCEARLIIHTPGECFIDVITTIPKFRRKGYGTALVEHLKTKFRVVAPIGISSAEPAQAFWKKLGMEDAMGLEEEYAEEWE